MIPCLAFLVCLLTAFTYENVLQLNYNENVVPTFKGQDFSVFISSETVISQNVGHLTYSLVNENNHETPPFQSFLMVCSFAPTIFSEYTQLAIFMKDYCQTVIPITPVLSEESSPDRCFSIDSTTMNLLLISFVTENQLPSYLNSQKNSVQVKIKYGACGDYGLTLIVGIETIQNTFHSDVKFSDINTDLESNDREVEGDSNTEGIMVKFGGIIGEPKCRKLIAWVENRGTFSYLAESMSGVVAINRKVYGRTIIMRCFLSMDENETKKEHTLITFLSYRGPTKLQVDANPRLHHPPISPKNPHICYSQSQNSPGFLSISDMEINGIIPYNNVSAQVSVLACMSDSNSGEDLCDGNFMAIFSGSPITLPDNSSFFLGPSYNHNMLGLLFTKQIQPPFCLDLKVAKNTRYMINVMLFAAAGGSIPPQSHHNIDLSCPYNYGFSLSAIMYRTHTHNLGRYVSMWVDHRNTWTLLASENNTNDIVQLSEPFHIRVNDTLNVRCTYDTHGVNTTTYIGESGEMCNFYLYYITNATAGREIRDCFIEKKFTPPYSREGEFYHQLPRRRVTFETNLELLASWSLQAQSIQGNLGICNLEHEGTILVILERYAEHFSQDKDWFDAENVLIDFRSVIKTNALTVFSMQNNTVLHGAGANRFYLPTGLYLSAEGELFITDLGLHQVVKFSRVKFNPSEGPELVLGTAFDPGNDSTHFCKPTSVLTDREENIYVGDGLCNTRIVKFEDDGYYVGSYGTSSSKRGLPGTFGEVTDLALDTTREVVLALDNQLLQIQVMDFLGNFYQVIDVSRYKNVLKICYSTDMDAILVLTSYGLESDIFILDPVTGMELNFISGRTRSFSAITVIPGNNTILVGDRSGRITMYSDINKVTNDVYENPNSKVHEFSAPESKVSDEKLTQLSPLIHFLYKPGLTDVEQPPKGRRHKFSRRLTMIVSASVVAALFFIVAIVFTVTFCSRCGSKREYEKCLLTDSEGEEDVLYDTLHESYENMRAL